MNEVHGALAFQSNTIDPNLKALVYYIFVDFFQMYLDNSIEAD